MATPEDFLGLLQAVATSGPSDAKPTPIEQFLGSHPAAAKWVSTPRPAPERFGTLAFYGVNAFKLSNAKGVAQFARYQILPVAGEKPLSEAQAKAASPNYLMDESRNGLPRGPSNFACWPNWPRTVTRSTTRPRSGPPNASWWNWARSA